MLSWGILTKPNSLLLRAAHSCYMEKVEKIETLSLIMASKSFFSHPSKKKKKPTKNPKLKHACSSSFVMKHQIPTYVGCFPRYPCFSMPLHCDDFPIRNFYSFSSEKTHLYPFEEKGVV